INYALYTNGGICVNEEEKSLWGALSGEGPGDSRGHENQITLFTIQSLPERFAEALPCGRGLSDTNQEINLNYRDAPPFRREHHCAIAHIPAG
ncbi:hypothetical protein ACFL43_07325, partial [Thermodesulfobacteriota bacterium]